MSDSKTTVNLHTLGCKLNQAESEILAWQLTQTGYSITNDTKANIYILNTCTVTHIADRKARHWLKATRRNNPCAFIITTGCYAARAPGEIKRLGIDLIVSNKEKKELPEIIKMMLPPKSGSPKAPIWNETRVRSLVKIQDGCNDFCTYCIVPKVRGREYSLSVEEIIREIKIRIDAGYKEIILTGTKIGSYHYRGITFKDLVENILKQSGVMRLRLSSLQPHEISPEFLSLWQDRRLCRHFHLPLQSGSDNVLRRMGRRYSVADFRRTVTSIRNKIPDVAITTDIMVGFPGETLTDFEATCQFCQEIGFARIHVFPYSPRPGTTATQLPEAVPEKEKRARMEKMLALSSLSTQSFAKQFLGQKLEVLWEKETTPGNGTYSGLTDNYIRVLTQSKKNLSNKLSPVHLVQLHQQGILQGKIAE